jgi:hypothetical protein
MWENYLQDVVYTYDDVAAYKEGHTDLSLKVRLSSISIFYRIITWKSYWELILIQVKLWTAVQQRL